jgi:hypothetical protein
MKWQWIKSVTPVLVFLSAQPGFADRVLSPHEVDVHRVVRVYFDGSEFSAKIIEFEGLSPELATRGGEPLAKLRQTGINLDAFAKKSLCRVHEMSFIRFMVASLDKEVAVARSALARLNTELAGSVVPDSSRQILDELSLILERMHKELVGDET